MTDLKPPSSHAPAVFAAAVSVSMGPDVTKLTFSDYDVAGSIVPVVAVVVTTQTARETMASIASCLEKMGEASSKVGTVLQ